MHDCRRCWEAYSKLPKHSNHNYSDFPVCFMNLCYLRVRRGQESTASKLEGPKDRERQFSVHVHTCTSYRKRVLVETGIGDPL